MSTVPPESGFEAGFAIDDDILFEVKPGQTLYGTIVKIIPEKRYARVRIFNSQRTFLVRLEALKYLTPDLTHSKE